MDKYQNVYKPSGLFISVCVWERKGERDREREKERERGLFEKVFEWPCIKF